MAETAGRRRRACGAIAKLGPVRACVSPTRNSGPAGLTWGPSSSRADTVSSAEDSPYLPPRREGSPRDAPAGDAARAPPSVPSPRRDGSSAPRIWASTHRAVS